MLTVACLFAGFLAGYVLTGESFTRSARHRKVTPAGCEHVWEPWGEPAELRIWGNKGGKHPIAIVYRQSRVCRICNEMDYKTRRIDG